MAFAMLLLFACAQAQTKPEALTNAGVIKLFKAGLDADIIRTKIASSACKFDLSSDGLINLKNAGLPADIIKSMMSASEPQAQSSPKLSAAPVEKQSATASTIPDIEIINAVYFFDRSTNAVLALEKQSATSKSQMKALGYGGVNLVFRVNGAKSTVRLTEDKIKSFLLNAGSAPADMFVLYKVEVKKNYRQAIGGKFDMLGMKGSQGVIAIDLKLAKPGIYELIPTTKLEKGEYFFALKAATNSITSSTDVYAFGVD